MIYDHLIIFDKPEKIQQFPKLKKNTNISANISFKSRQVFANNNFFRCNKRFRRVDTNVLTQAACHLFGNV